MIVLDTHALVWWATDDSRLSRKARQATRAHARRSELIASAASVFEIVTLERRGRLALRLPVSEWLSELRVLPELTLHPVTDEIAEWAGGLGDPVPGDPADRLIACTALVLAAPLVTQDERLRAVPGLATIW